MEAKELLAEAAELLERAPDTADRWSDAVWAWLRKYHTSLADSRLKPTVKDLEPVPAGPER